MTPTALIISVSSDIGIALAKEWSGRGWHVFGTHRTRSAALDELEKEGKVTSFACDLADVASVEAVCKKIHETMPSWDVLVLSAGNLEPIGNFAEVDFDAWEESLQINLLRQLRIVHRLLPSRRQKSALSEPSVLFFAGGGTNNAVLRYSSYTLSKIALTKMCEFLDAEIPDTRFLIIGPGIVKTKIHEPTLRLGEQGAGANYQKLVQKLDHNECTPMEKVVECCTWAVTTPSRGVRGRNFSVVSDRWGSPCLERELEEDEHMYKLRRHKNAWVPHETNC